MNVFFLPPGLCACQIKRYTYCINIRFIQHVTHIRSGSCSAFKPLLSCGTARFSGKAAVSYENDGRTAVSSDIRIRSYPPETELSDSLIIKKGALQKCTAPLPYEAKLYQLGKSLSRILYFIVKSYKNSAEKRSLFVVSCSETYLRGSVYLFKQHNPCKLMRESHSAH